MGRPKGAFRTVLEREWGRMTSRRLYFGVTVVLPLFCLLLMSTVFGGGEMENIPIGVVDMDDTAASRRIVEAVAALPTTRITHHFVDHAAARQAVESKEIYAYAVIPADFESNLVGGRAAVLPYYYHYALLSVGVEIRSAFESVLETLAVAPVVEAGLASGATMRSIESFIMPVEMEAHPLFNPTLDYSVYLSYPFFFILFQILILLSTAYAVGIEIKFRTAGKWLAAARGDIFTAVVAKLLPYTVIFIVIGLAAHFVLFGPVELPFEGGIAGLIGAMALFVVATQSFGVFIFSLFPALGIIISIVSMVGSLGATLSGVTFPLEGMYPPIRLLGSLFPVRHFVEIVQNTLYGDYGFAFAWRNYAFLAAFPLLALLLLPRLKRAVLSRKYENIE